MYRQIKTLCTWTLIFCVLLTGCQPMQPYYLKEDGDMSLYLDVATEIEYTDVCQEPLEEVSRAQPPRTLSDPDFAKFWDLTLEEVMHIALNNSKVIRSVGSVRQFGQVIGGAPERLSQAPSSIATVYDTAIQETSQSGVEQALATFDAIFSSTATWDNTDRLQNFSADVNAQARDFQQDQITLNNEISKLSATGTQWFFRNNTIYSRANNFNSSRIREVPSDWFTAFEAEFRHPLMRNRGAQVNRIPVVLARIRTDNSLIDFETSVMEFVRSVEHSYWELYYFYHNLYAAKMGRDSSLASWQKVKALLQSGADGGEADKEGQARQQYYTFRAQVESAQRDLFKSETRLRYLMGITPTDDRMIRPADKPTFARVEFDWNVVVEETLHRSPNLRRQGWQIKARELELIAARNQLLPQFDIIGLYRWLGQGDHFRSDVLEDDNHDGDDIPNYPTNAIDRLWSGDTQEFRMGFDFNMPLGFRSAMSQVSSSQLALARERARIQEMELEAVHQLTDAQMDLDANYRILHSNFNRRIAARDQVQALEAAYQAGTTQLEFLLDAQRQQSDANIAYYRSLVDYNLAIVAMHFRKGSILDYNGIVLAEGPWPSKAYFDATNHARRRSASHYLDYGFSRPSVISRGPASKRWPQGSAATTGQHGGLIQPDSNTYSETEDDSYDPSEAIEFDNGDVFDSPAGDSTRPNRLRNNLGDSVDGVNDSNVLPPPSGPNDTPQPLQNGAPVGPEGDLQFDNLEARRPARTASRRRTHPRRRSGGVQIEWR